MSDGNRKEELNNKALELYVRGEYQDAAECLDTLLVEFPDEHGARTFKAWCQMDAGDLESAYRTFMENKELDSNNPRLWHGLSLTLKAMGFEIGALPAIEKAIALTPDVAEFHYEKASVLFLMDRMDESLESLDGAISLQHDHQKAWTLKGRVLMIMGRHDRALDAFIHAKDLNPDDPMIRMSISTMLKDECRNDEALSMIDEAIDIAVNPRPFIFHKAELLEDMEMYDEAVSAYREGLNLEIEIDTPYKQAMEEAALQSIGSVLYGMGFSLQMLGHHEEAMSYLDALLEVNPYDAKAWHRKAYGLNVLDRYEEAMTAYDKVNELEPSSLAHTSKGEILMQLKRSEEALSSYDLALQMDENDDYIWGIRGECLEALERYKEAEESYRKELDICNDCPSKWMDLARVQSVQGNADDAVTSYREAIALCDRIEDEHGFDLETRNARSEAIMRMKEAEQSGKVEEYPNKHDKKSNRAVFVEPPKPVNEMNEEELEEFAEKVLEALKGNTKDGSEDL